MVLEEKEIADLMARKKAIQDTLAAQSGCASGPCCGGSNGGGCDAPAAKPASRGPQVAAAVAVAAMLFWAVVVWLR